MPGNNVLTGGRVRFFLNGKPMGYAMGVNVTETLQQEPINVLDNIRPVEFATVGYSVQLRCQIYRLPNRDLVAAGLWPQQGRTPDEMKRLFLDFEPMTADLYDSYSNAWVGKVFGVVPTTRTLNFQNRGIVMNDVTFVAVGFSDEGSPQV
jgi:hypothetical protein